MELLEILNDYKENFCNKMCCIETAYKEMEFINIYFSKTDLHHLLGFHKVLPGNATKTINDIENGNLTINGNTTQIGNTSQTGNVSITGGVTATEDVQGAGKSLKGHTHTYRPGDQSPTSTSKAN